MLGYYASISFPFMFDFNARNTLAQLEHMKLEISGGAMVGHADKGLFITTGGFTKSAEREAVRDGTPAIDLIDGTDLCNLLKDLNLGVITESVERVRPQPDFFQGF